MCRPSAVPARTERAGRSPTRDTSGQCKTRPRPAAVICQGLRACALKILLCREGAHAAVLDVLDARSGWTSGQRRPEGAGGRA
jgi:hypothetical protein